MKNWKIWLVVGFAMIAFCSMLLLIYLVNYFPQFISLILDVLGNTVDKSIFQGLDIFTFLSLFLSIISIVVSIILTYVVYKTSKNRTTEEFNSIREIAYLQTISSLEMIYDKRYSSIQSLEKFIEDSYRFKPLFQNLEFNLLLEIWESIISIKNTSGDIQKDRIEYHNHLVRHPIASVIIKEYPICLTQIPGITSLLNRDTIIILNKLNPLKKSIISYTSRKYIDGSNFINIREIEKSEKICVYSIEGNEIYNGTFNMNLRFCGYGKIQIPKLIKVPASKLYNSYYIGQIENGVPHGTGVEFLIKNDTKIVNDIMYVTNNIDEKIVLKDGKWVNCTFTEGKLFHVRMIDNKSPELPISHLIQNEKYANINDDSLDDTIMVISGDLEFHDNIFVVKKIRSIREHDYMRKINESIATTRRSTNFKI